MMRLGSLIMLFLVPLLCSAQLSVAVDALPDSIKFGDEVTFNYKINVPANVDLTSLDFSSLLSIENAAYQADTTMFDKIMDVDLIDGGVFGITENNLIATKAKDGTDIPRQGAVTVRISSIGAFSLPIPKLGHLSTELEVPLQRKPLFVLPRGEQMELNENKSIIEESIKWTDYLIYLYILIGFAVLGMIGYFISKKLNKEVVTLKKEEVVIKRPAHIIAIESLSSLKDKELWQNGEEKEYHTELTRIMRQYVEDRYEVQALEMTTSQLNKAMSSQGIDKGTIDRFIDILQIADKVKFAKGKTGPEINENFMTDALGIVNNTKKIQIEQTETE